ncbi:MAG: type transport system permease protein [Actinomycetota bacterium]|jgi:ABC-2 type transport system permease protein|nr:type transport system permease protein [Actinomycetota bacterium]
MSATRDITIGLAERSVKLIPRMPSTFVPSLIMPIFLVVSFSGAFAGLTQLPGFPADKMIDWVFPMTTLQGCAFAGVTTAMAIARDLDNGFYDRLIGSPAPRISLMLGPLLASVIRGMIPLTILLIVAVIGGANFNGGFPGLGMLVICAMSISFIAGCWGLGLAFRAKTQQIAPLMQMGLFTVFFLSTAQMPIQLLTGWIHQVARFNPITNVLQMARQVSLPAGVTWATTWPGFVSLAGMAAVLGLFAYRGLLKIVD